MLLLIDSTAVACARNYDLNMDSEAIPLSNIQTGTYANSQQGIKNWALTAEHLLPYNKENFDDIWGFWDAGTVVTVEMQDSEKDSQRYLSSGWIKTLNEGAPFDNMGRMNFVLIGSAPITREPWNLIDELGNNMVDELDDNLISN